MVIKNERGMTLVEVLAVLVIGAIFLIIITQILFFGIRAYENTKVEADLRDEADIIMANLIREIYVLKTSEIKHHYLPKEGTNNYYIELVDGEKIGFINGNVHVKEQVLPLNDHIQLVFEGGGKEAIGENEVTMIEQKDKGYYLVQLKLQEEHSGQSIELQSEIAIIQDDKDEGE